MIKTNMKKTGARSLSQMELKRFSNNLAQF